MRATLVPVMLAILPAAVLAGCLGGDDAPPAGPAPPAATDRWSTQKWKEALSEPVYDGIVTSIVRVAAADGTGLTMTVNLPEGLDSDAKIPTLLQITPYQAGRVYTPATGTEPPPGAWGDYVLYGAAYVEADARGTNGSDGCLDFGGSADRSDAQVFHDWIVSQPWSDGLVVTDGVSHPGMGSVVAHAAVPALTAALAHAPVVSYYQDQWILGARMEQLNELYQPIELAPALYADPEALAGQAAPCTGETLLQFGQVDGPFTELWADRDLSRHIDPATASPILMTQGFIDLNVHPDHVQMYWDALPEDFPKHLILGYWYHGWPDMEDHPADDFLPLRHRWLDATLFGIDNGLDAEPRVLVEDSTGTWHEGDQWPLEPSEWVTMYPSSDGALAATVPAAGEVPYLDAQGAERGYWTDAAAVFRTEPLAADRLVNGAPVVTLVASSDVDQTKWVAYLLDEAPDGSWQRISHSYADSHVWGGEGTWQPMEPGTAYTWNITLFPTAVVVPAGHSVVLLIASQDSEIAANAQGQGYCFDDHRDGCYNPTGIVPSSTVGRATNTVHVGPDATLVRWAWVDPAMTKTPPA